MEYVGALTNVSCAWKAFLFLVLTAGTYKSNAYVNVTSECCACCDALCSSPGKKGIILFLGSFCPPSIGNLSRIRICKSERESKDELRCETQKHAFLFAVKKIHVSSNSKASLSSNCLMAEPHELYFICHKFISQSWKWRNLRWE